MAQEGQLALRSSQPLDILCCFSGLIYFIKQGLFMCSSSSSSSSKSSSRNSSSFQVAGLVWS